MLNEKSEQIGFHVDFGLVFSNRILNLNPHKLRDGMRIFLCLNIYTLILMWKNLKAFLDDK